MNNNTLKSLLILFVSAAAPLAASAQLVSYAFPGYGDNGTPLTPTTTNSAGATGSYALGAGLAGGSNTFIRGYQVQGTLSNDGYPSSLSGAEADAAYYTFTISPTTGDELTLTNFDLSDTTLYAGDSASTFALESSVTGFGSGDTLATFASTGNQSMTNGSNVALGLEFADQTAPVEFRLYVYGSGNYQSVSLVNGPLKIDGVATPVLVNTPEPNTCLLVGLGLASLVFAGRKLRQT